MKKLLISVLWMVGFITTSVYGAVSTSPLFLSETADSRVMLVMSNDHQLSVKAYTDYSDLDGDGSLDTTYDDSIEYSGYFNPDRCYLFDSGDNRFEPATNVDAGTHQCTSSSSDWSGNFLNWATMTRMDMVRKVFYGGLRSVDRSETEVGALTGGETVLERAYLPRDVHSFVKVFTAGSSAEMGRYAPFSETSISLCNLTNSSSGDPLLRVAEGEWPAWSSVEGRQCQFHDTAAAPASGDRLGGSDYEVYVQVCVPGSRESNCYGYADGSLKPGGVLQEYGQADNSSAIRFGLMTGSYGKNKDGGVLRRNLERITGHTGADASKNEIDLDTGQFINQSGSDEGIIDALNRIGIAGYNYSNGKHEYSCNTPGIDSFANGVCVDWGNPLSELYLEALNYLSGASATSTFTVDDSAWDDYRSEIGGLQSVTWSDPLAADESCANMSIITVSTGLNSFDTDNLSNSIGIDVDAKTDEVGVAEGIGSTYLLGDDGTATNKGKCTAKSISGLSDAKGICPELPAQEGGYHIAGLAYHARTEDMRTATGYDDDQFIHTYAVSLAESLPNFNVPLPVGSSASSVSILPHCESNSDGDAYRDNATTGWRTCSITDVAVLYSSDIEGKFLIGWEDSPWGNDYDMDGMMTMEYCAGPTCSNTSIADSALVGSNQIRVKITVEAAGAGFAMRFGYTISGTSADEVNVDAGRDGNCNWNYGDSPNFSSSNCNGGQLVQVAENTYTQGSSSGANLLENPLFYTAKYGGFVDTDDDVGVLNTDEQWDADGDGVPDAYFKVSNPAELTAALNGVLSAIEERDASASAVTTNATRIDTNTRAYRALFNSANWSGQLLSIPIADDGTLVDRDDPRVWDASEQLSPIEHASRNIFSYNASDVGFEFITGSLTDIQTIAVALGASSPTAEQVDYIRGDQSNEEQRSGSFRNRPIDADTGQGNVLGDIINSDPVYVSNEDYGYEHLGGTVGPAYTTFRTTNQTRTPMLYVGANDGMLHGFNANTGDEVFAYIPRGVYGDLFDLTSPAYTHKYYVDGSPAVSDAYINSAWHTVLVGTTAAGGASVFALDITKPDDGSTPFSGSDVLWEINATVGGDFDDLGYTFGKPSIVYTGEGWVAIFGNGYESTNGNAVIYVVNLEDGTLLKRFDTETAGTGNGMSSPVVIDTNSDYVADMIYAGDLNGNLWKIDIAGNNASAWGFEYTSGGDPAPFFVAQDPVANAVQPITAQPQVGRHPDAGVMIYFGTGQYYETGDNVTTGAQIQSYYGLHDNFANNNELGVRTSAVASLVEQSITHEFVPDTDGDEETGTNLAFFARITSDNDVVYPTKRGWYMDFDFNLTRNAGERVINQGLLLGDRLVFTTLTPSQDKCDFGGTSWLMEVEALTGKRFDKPVLDVNNDGVIDEDDSVEIVVGGETITVYPTGLMDENLGITDNPAVLNAGQKEVKILGGSSGGTASIGEANSVPTGRIGWQQLR